MSFTEEQITEFKRRLQEDVFPLPLPDTPDIFENQPNIVRTSIQHDTMENSGKSFMEKEVVTKHGTFKEKELFEMFEQLPLSIQEELKEKTLEELQKRYLDRPIEKIKKDFTRLFEKEIERPMVACVQCGKAFPYGSKDGKCDGCQIAGRVIDTKCDIKKCDDFCCCDDIDELDERQTGMVMRLREMRKEVDSIQCEYVTFETWFPLPVEELLPKFHWPSIRVPCDVVIHHLQEARKNLDTVDMFLDHIDRDTSYFKTIETYGQAVRYWIALDIAEAIPWPLTTKEEGDKFLEAEKKAREYEAEMEAQELLEEAEKEEARRAKAEAKKAEQEAKKAEGKEKSKTAFNPPEYPPAQKIKCKGSAQMISNAPAQRAWLDKWAQGAWNGKDLWSAKTAKQYVADRKNGVGTLFASPVVVEAVLFDGVEAEPIED